MSPKQSSPPDIGRVDGDASTTPVLLALLLAPPPIARAASSADDARDLTVDHCIRDAGGGARTLRAAVR